MDIEIGKAICYSISKAYTTGVRLYQNETRLCYYSPYNITPDPLQPFLHQILDSDREAGIITTPLFQFYAFLTLKPELRIIIGPTRALKDNGKAMDELLTMLRIRKEERENYMRWLCSAPVINIGRLAWLLVSLETILKQRIFSVEEVWIDHMPKGDRQSVQIEYDENRMNNVEDMGISQAIRQRYSWEGMIFSYIENGRTEKLREIFTAPPKVYAGNNVYDGLRQMKNRGISMTACASQAAIRGGMDLQQSFLMDELYTQRIELAQELSSLENLIQEMIFDFAEQVEKLHYPVGNKDSFGKMCIQYISRNVFSHIQIENMAKELGYSRPYLCSRFKQEMGITLTQYIQQVKVEEAKRMLQFSDYNLSEIAGLLSFSSQSHFQTVFKKISGLTPLAYQKQVRIIKHQMKRD